MISREQAVEAAVAFYRDYFDLTRRYGGNGWSWSCPAVTLTSLGTHFFLYDAEIQGVVRRGCLRGGEVLRRLTIQVAAETGEIMGYREGSRPRRG